jgi:hypothetical protein
MSHDELKDQDIFIQDIKTAKSGELTEKFQASFTQRVAQDFNPSWINVSLNLIGIHFVSSLMTLSICPQFGVRLVGQGHGLMAYFMPLGMLGCFTLCGLFYLMVTTALTKFFFNHAQWRKLKESYVLYMLSLSLSSLLLFSFIQGLFILHLSLAWLAGALIGAYLLKWTPWPHRTQIYL